MNKPTIQLLNVEQGLDGKYYPVFLLRKRIGRTRYARKGFMSESEAHAYGIKVCFVFMFGVQVYQKFQRLQSIIESMRESVMGLIESIKDAFKSFFRFCRRLYLGIQRRAQAVLMRWGVSKKYSAAFVSRAPFWIVYRLAKV